MVLDGLMARMVSLNLEYIQVKVSKVSYGFIWYSWREWGYLSYMKIVVDSKIDPRKNVGWQKVFNKNHALYV